MMFLRLDNMLAMFGLMVVHTFMILLRFMVKRLLVLLFINSFMMDRYMSKLLVFLMMIILMRVIEGLINSMLVEGNLFSIMLVIVVMTKFLMSLVINCMIEFTVVIINRVLTNMV